MHHAPQATAQIMKPDLRAAEPSPANRHRAMSSAHDGVKTFAATELTFSPESPNRISLTRNPQPAISDDAGNLQDQTDDSRDAEVFSKPDKSGKLIWGGGVGVVAVIAVILYLVLSPSSSSGFSLVVKGVPAGSQVFINEARRDAVANDGALKLSGLDPGTLNLRVSHEGFTDFMTTLTGAKGEVQTCEAQFLPEIDYVGPMIPIPAGEFEMG